jgi:SAM-dependent methyltransferase
MTRAAAQWQSSPMGAGLIQAEAELLSTAMDDVYGLELLQMGRWGSGRQLMQASRLRRQSLVAESVVGDTSPDIVASLKRLPIGSGLIDAVLLPHSLETELDPHAVLREAERILGGEGQLVVLGFRPVSLWGLRSLTSDGGYPPGLRRHLSEHRVRDWLVLLGFEITLIRRYLYVWPGAYRQSPGPQGLLKRGLLRPWPAGAYLIKARKHTYALTPIRPRRVERRTRIGALVEPSILEGRLQADVL